MLLLLSEGEDDAPRVRAEGESRALPIPMPMPVPGLALVLPTVASVSDPSAAAETKYPSPALLAACGLSCPCPCCGLVAVLVLVSDGAGEAGPKGAKDPKPPIFVVVDDDDDDLPLLNAAASSLSLSSLTLWRSCDPPKSRLAAAGESSPRCMRRYSALAGLAPTLAFEITLLLERFALLSKNDEEDAPNGPIGATNRQSVFVPGWMGTERVGGVDVPLDWLGPADPPRAAKPGGVTDGVGGRRGVSSGTGKGYICTPCAVTFALPVPMPAACESKRALRFWADLECLVAVGASPGGAFTFVCDADARLEAGTEAAGLEELSSTGVAAFGWRPLPARARL